MIGLTGSHRVGKTTLAEAFSKENDVPFLRTSTSEVFKSLGLDPSQDYSFDVRLDVQEKVLEAAEALYAGAAGRAFVTDRTPIDMMAYTLADVQQGTLTPELSVRLQAYLKRCVAVTNRYFSVLVVVQPGIPVVYEEGKCSLEPSYIEHISKLVMGLVVDESITASHFYIPTRITDLDRRVECLEFVIARINQRHVSQLEIEKERGIERVIH